MRESKELVKLDKLAEKKKLEMDQEKLSLIQGVQNVVLPFIRRRRLIVYGGTAFNQILPEHARFYKNDIISDYDCFSVNAYRDARNLADLLDTKGYRYVHVKRAVHDKTYRVFAEQMSIADISVISEDFYSRLMFLSKNDYELHRLPFIPAPLHFLRFAMYNEMSKPRESARRWHKVFTRLGLFLNHFPITPVNQTPKSPTTSGLVSEADMKRLVASIKKVAVAQSLPIGGMAVIAPFLGESATDDWQGTMGMIDLLSMNANATAETVARRAVDVLKARPADVDIIIETRPFGAFASTTYETTYVSDNEPISNVVMLPEYIVCVERRGTPSRVNIANIYDAHYSCKSVYSKYKPVHMSWDTIMTILFGRMIVQDADDLKKLVEAIERKLKVVHVADRVSIDCYGHTPSKEEVMQKRWDERLKTVLYIPK